MYYLINEKITFVNYPNIIRLLEKSDTPYEVAKPNRWISLQDELSVEDMVTTGVDSSDNYNLVSISPIPPEWVGVDGNPPEELMHKNIL